MQFLIDGYNLMHVVGYLSGKPSGKLAPIRTRFLDWLAGIAKAREVAIRVVFDGQNSPERTSETRYRGVRVRFAFEQTADDEIETLLRTPLPADTAVVSNDTRLHESARRAKIAAWDCQKFLDWTLRIEAAKIEKLVLPEKPDAGEEDRELLAAFLQPRGPGR